MAQVVCVPARPSEALARDFLLKPAPLAKKYKNLGTQSPLPRRRNSNPRSPLSPNTSFLNLFDTPAITQRCTPQSATSLATPSPRPNNSKRNARAFDGLSSLKAISTPFHIVTRSTTTQGNQFKELEAKLTFLHRDPYSAATKLLTTFSGSPTLENLHPSPIIISQLDLSPSSSPEPPRKRSNTTSRPAPPSQKTLKKVISLSNFVNAMSSSQTSTTSSSTSKSSSAASKKQHKRPDKVLPFTTSQLAELDRLMGNPDAAKGKKPSSFASGTHGHQEKQYIAPYVPLGGSAPRGTRSVGRDGVPHPTASLGPNNINARQVATGGNSLPYFKDENGVMWSGQDEVDEYASLITPTNARYPEPHNHHEKQKSKGARKGSVPNLDGWRQFSATSSSFDSTHCSPLSAARKNSDEFDLGGQDEFEYDEAVMVPEGGVAVGGVRTVGGLALAAGGARGGVGRSVRGGESFPVPFQVDTSSLHYSSSSQAPRPRGVERRRLPSVPNLESNSASSSSTSLGLVGNRSITAQDDVEGRQEFFADAFHPSPVTPTYHIPVSKAPTAGPPVASRAKRHSLSSGFFAALGHQPSQQASGGGVGYLPPLGAYNGIRQSSFSGPLSPSAPSPSFFSYSSSVPPVPSIPPHVHEVKKKSSTLGIFRKMGSK